MRFKAQVAETQNKRLVNLFHTNFSLQRIHPFLYYNKSLHIIVSNAPTTTRSLRQKFSRIKICLRQVSFEGISCVTI